MPRAVSNNKRNAGSPPLPNVQRMRGHPRRTTEVPVRKARCCLSSPTRVPDPRDEPRANRRCEVGVSQRGAEDEPTAAFQPNECGPSGNPTRRREPCSGRSSRIVATQAHAAHEVGQRLAARDQLLPVVLQRTGGPTPSRPRSNRSTTPGSCQRRSMRPWCRDNVGSLGGLSDHCRHACSQCRPDRLLEWDGRAQMD